MSAARLEHALVVDCEIPATASWAVHSAGQRRMSLHSARLWIAKAWVHILVVGC